jgi:hypothetical protein
MRSTITLTTLLATPCVASAGPVWLPLKDLAAKAAAIAEVQVVLSGKKHHRVKRIRWLLKPRKGVRVPQHLAVCIESQKHVSARKKTLFSAYCYQNPSNRKGTYKQTWQTWTRERHPLPRPSSP